MSAKAEILRMSEAGASARTIALSLGLSIGHVYRVVRLVRPRLVGSPSRDRNEAATTFVEEPQPVARGGVVSRAEVIRLHRRGVGIISIASMLRIPYREVIAICEAGE